MNMKASNLSHLFHLITLLLSIPATSGCLDALEEEQNNDLRIRLGGNVSSPMIATKTQVNGVIDQDTPVSMDIRLIRWDQSDTDDNPWGRKELDATMGKPTTTGPFDRPILFADNSVQFYRNKTDQVGFAGWFPTTMTSSTENRKGAWVTGKDGNVIQKNSAGNGARMTYNIDGNTDVMISDFTKGTFSQPIPPIHFKHALCMYKIYAYAISEEAAEEWGKIEQIELVNLPEQLFIDLPQDIHDSNEMKISFSPAPTGHPTDEDSYTTTIVKPREGFVLPAGTPDKESCYLGTVLGGSPAIGLLGIKARTCKLTGGNGQKIQAANSVSIARNFKPGYTHNIFLRFSSKGVINAEVSSEDWIYDGIDHVIDQGVDLLTDLSRYGTANSYIVSSGNRGYCFDATVKGNGVNTLPQHSGASLVLPDKSVALNVNKVKILWSECLMKADENGNMVPTTTEEERNLPVIELLSDRTSYGKIMFLVPGNTGTDGKPVPGDFRLTRKGNVLIGALDARNEIIWSWHIWVTDKPLNEGYSNGTVAQDRNLGAVSSEYSTAGGMQKHMTGLYYQWGRKDPMNPDFWNETAADGSPKIQKVASRVSVAEAHKHPMTYYYSASRTTPQDNFWTTDIESNDAFWGYTGKRTNIRKTIYDPCPPGYRMSSKTLWTENRTQKGTQLGGGTADPAGYALKLNDYINVNYPVSQFIADGELKDSDLIDGNPAYNAMCFQYTATPVDMVRDRKTDEKFIGTAPHFRFDGTDIVNTVAEDPAIYHTARADAYPVRCVLESSNPAVTDLSESQTANCYLIRKSGFYTFRVDTRGNGVTGLNIYDFESKASFYRSFNAGLSPTIDNVAKVGILWWQGDLKSESRYMKFLDMNRKRISRSEMEEYCPVILLDDGAVEDGKAMIYVNAMEKAGGNNGSVGIAAYDQNGKILWTWHIWVQAEFNHVTLGNYTLMDRNLGATYCPTDKNDVNRSNFNSTLGFYYQWGRKDPFFGPDETTPTIDENGAMTGNIPNRTETRPWYRKVEGKNEWIRQTTNATGAWGTIPSSVEHPLTFYQGGGEENNFWQSTYTASNGAVQDLWGYVGSSGKVGSSFAKTMYDPCPPGYRVMQHDVFQTANICDDNGTDSYALTDAEFFNFPYGVYLTGNARTSYNGNNVKTSGIWLSNSGYMNTNGDIEMGYSGLLDVYTPIFGEVIYKRYHWFPYGRLNSATPMYNPTSSHVYCREIRWCGQNIIKRINIGFGSYDEKITHEYHFQQENGESSADNRLANAKTIRCQME